MQFIREEVRKTRLAMEKSRFSTGLRDSMSTFFGQLNDSLDASTEIMWEIRAMMTAMYQKFSDDHGLAMVNPPEHSLVKYRREVARLERIFDERFNTLFSMITSGHHQITQRFYETLVRKVVQVFEIANSETETWLKALIAPMETQVREHKTQLKRRFDSVSRIHAATETLDDRIAELDTAMNGVADQMEQLARVNGRIVEALDDTPGTARYARSA